MPRLIDDLRAPDARLAKPMFVYKHNEWMDLARRLNELLMDPQLPVLLIDNVADYYYAAEQEHWDLSKDFPNLAPPYPSFWCECKTPRKIHSKECGDSDLSNLLPHGRVGMLIHGVAREDAVGEGIPDNVRWILWCELYIDYGRRGVVADGPHGSMFLCVDDAGVIVDRPWMQSLAHDSDAHIMKSLMVWLYPAFLAISFLHCKNVGVVENQVPAPLAKKYYARHGIRPTGYKTLVIEPLKRILRSEGRSDQVGVPRAMHICRGHFADYTQGRGLFGKYHGKFWMPSVVRGSKGESAQPREARIKI